MEYYEPFKRKIRITMKIKRIFAAEMTSKKSDRLVFKRFLMGNVYDLI